MDALDCPAAIQSSFNRNLELVYRSSSGYLRHVYFDQASQWWYDGSLFGPAAPRGIPGFVQGNRGAPGDFEVVVIDAAGAVEHWTKHNGSPWTRPPGTWYKRATIASGMAAAGPALVSSRRGLTSELEQETGRLHYVCSAGSGLRHFRYSLATTAWVQVTTFGAGSYSGPCMIESLNPTGNELAAGNLEVFVETANQVEHWMRPAPGPGNPGWTLQATFGAGVRRVIGALQGSSSVFEVYVERTDGRYQQYTRPGANWVAGPVIP
jgi:hypothetical protein